MSCGHLKFKSASGHWPLSGQSLKRHNINDSKLSYRQFPSFWSVVRVKPGSSLSVQVRLLVRVNMIIGHRAQKRVMKMTPEMTSLLLRSRFRLQVIKESC